MGKQARKYTEKTLKRLFALSGNQCSFPSCNKAMVNENNAKDSNICHIEAANPNGERYRDGMTDIDRSSYDNLILLCVQHHDETNDVSKYTVAILKQMKIEHTSSYLSNRINKNPSMLRNIINEISNIDIDGYVDNGNLDAFNIKNKIKHNNVKKYAHLIQEYKVYHYKLNSLYDELEAQGSLKKGKILQNIKSYYLKAKGGYVNNSEGVMDQIKLHADDIIDDVLNSLSLKLDGCGLSDEDIILGLELVVVDAFMRCKILEEPK